MRSSRRDSADAAPPPVGGGLRVDVALDRLCLMKTRSQAAKACSLGHVFINGELARASKEVRVGDRLRYQDRLARHEEEVLILHLPERAVAKAFARDCYERISRRLIEDAEAPPGGTTDTHEGAQGEAT